MLIEVRDRCPSSLLKSVEEFPITLPLLERKVIEVPRTFAEPIDEV